MNGRDRMLMDSTALVVWLTGSSALPHLKTLHPESAPPSFEEQVRSEPTRCHRLRS